MTVPFYKLQIGGSGFVLIDTERIKTLSESVYTDVAIRLCSRRYGIGASGCIFIEAQNVLRFFSRRGTECAVADDALLCAARYAFDSGRIEKTETQETTICFYVNAASVRLTVLDSHNFRLSLGAPFSALSSQLLTRDSAGIFESIVIDGKRIGVSALHLHDDVFVVLSSSQQHFSLYEFALRVQQQFPDREIHPVFAQAVTRESIIVKTVTRGMSLACSTAASSLIAAYTSGVTADSAIVLFDELQKDTDNSRKLTAQWDIVKNELSVIGTGGYIFEGKFDI